MKKKHKAALTRREFCGELAGTTAAVVAGSTLLVDDAQAQYPAVAYPPTKIEGASALLPGSALLFNYPQPRDAAILVRTDERSFYAYSQKCPHLGCSIHFSSGMNRLECPCHQGSFDVKSGLCLDGPSRRALNEIVLQVRGGEVWAVGRRREIENPIV
jgi:nitrite reductase/ring-hydroxylating ferredoxin subunit